MTRAAARHPSGNIDNKELGAGTTEYFPVFVEGALFSAGDGHALQGDGEVCLTAIETELQGTFEFRPRTDLKLTWPRAESSDAWITMGFDEDLDDPVKIALREALILQKSELSAQDAADLRMTQMVDGNKGIHCVLAKNKLATR